MKKLIGIVACIMLLGLSCVYAQTKEITGAVIDNSGLGLPGVSVLIKGTTKGTATDINGRYTISATSKDILVVSFIGMKTQEITVGDKKQINVTLEDDRVAVEEVVVTGYGTQKKSSFTGSVGTVGEERISTVPTANPVRALEGASAGVQVLSGSGQPGSAPKIRIRGISSLNASQDPLYVVDGMIYDGNISNIASSDIKSMTILKDAASTALYGARGGNGVIVITTKSGKAGDVNVQIRASVGFSERAIPEYERVNSQEYYELAWEAYKNGLLVNDAFIMAEPDAAKREQLAREAASRDLISEILGTNMYDVPNDQLIDPVTGKLNPNAQPLFNDKLEDIMYRTGVRQEYGISVSGGTKKTKYYFSVGTLDDQGILADSDFKRKNARIKIDTKVNDWFKIGTNLSVSQGRSSNTKQTDGAASAVFSTMRNIAPIYAAWLRDANGDLILNGEGNKQIAFGKSPEYFKRKFNAGTSILARRYDPDIYKRNNYIANFYAEIEPIKDIKAKVVYNKSINNYNNLDHTNMLYGDGALDGGRTYRKFYTGDSYTFQQFLTFDKTIDSHHINIAAIHENYETRYEYMNGTKKGFPVPNLDEFKAAATISSLVSGAEIYRTEAFLLKSDYSYQGKYYANASYRSEASSRFHKDNRWGSFWSLGGAWRVSAEDFLSDISWLNNLRVKASYGTNGNDNIGGYYPYQALFTTGRNDGPNSGLRISSFANEELTWEKQNKFNAGFDATLFDNLIGLEVDFFRTETSDLLFDRPIPRSSGLSTVSKNIGAMVNMGFEYVLSVHPVKRDNFQWDVAINLTHYKNEVTELSEEFIRNGNKAYQVGKSAYEFYMYESAGVDPATGALQWYKDIYKKDDEGNIMKDSHGNKLIESKELTTVADDATEKWLGSSLPDFFGGLTNTISYKGLKLTTNLTYSVGGQVIDYAYDGLMGRSGTGSAWHKDILNRWTEPGQVTDVPKLVWSGNQMGQQNETRYLVDASYLNISNIAISYTLPKSLLSKMGIKSISINASVSNLAFFSERKGLNSAYSISGGTESDIYSPLRTYTFGTTINF